MFNKVQQVKPLENYSLLVQFENNDRKLYDIKPLFYKWDVFRSLQTIPGLFEQVRIDTGGYGISWNDELDLSCDELYLNGVDIGGISDAGSL